MTGRDLVTGGSGPDGTEEARQRDQLQRARRRRERDLVDRDRYAPQAPLVGAPRRCRPGMAMGLAGGICVLAATAGAAVVLAPRSPDPGPPASPVTSTPTTSAEPVVTSAPPAIQGPPAAPAGPVPPAPPVGAGPGLAQAGPDGPAAGGPGRGPR